MKFRGPSYFWEDSGEAEELILNTLAEGLDPEQRGKEYIEAALDLIKQAEKELKEDNLRQASGKIWGAAALAIKAHALAKRGLRLEAHRDLWVYKNEVAKELGECVKAVFRQADSMHRNFYEDLATKEDVEDTLRDVRKLVEAIYKSIKRNTD